MQIKYRTEVNKMEYGSNQELESEIKRLQNKKVIFIIIGAIIAIACLVGIIFLNIHSNKVTNDATEAYVHGEISYDELVRIINGLVVLTLIDYVLGFGITGGIALAVAGGIVCHCKANNRKRILRRRNVANDYGGNGVEF